MYLASVALQKMVQLQLVASVLTLCLLLCPANCTKWLSGEEPNCLSRYDFEEKLLEKMVKLSHAFDLLEDNVERKISEMESTITDLEAKMDNLSPKQNTKSHEGPGTPNTCPDRSVLFKTSCYLFGHGQALTFVDAEDYCRQHGGHLVQVEDAAENAFLRDYSRTLKGNFWVGMTDETAEGVWKWYHTGTPLTVSGWTPGAPDDYGGNEDCAIYSSTHSFLWNDISCVAFAEALCKIKFA